MRAAKITGILSSLDRCCQPVHHAIYLQEGGIERLCGVESVEVQVEH